MLVPLLLALTAATPIDAFAVSDESPFALSLDAEHTVAARAERALGAGVSASAPLIGPLSFDVATAMGRDLPVLDAPVEGPMKLGAKAGLTLSDGDLALSVAGVLENGEPRIDTSLSYGVLSLEAEGASTFRLLATFEW
jgi:hypothetical protein